MASSGARGYPMGADRDSSVPRRRSVDSRQNGAAVRVAKWILPDNWAVFWVTGTFMTLLALPVTLLTQPFWAPFDKVLSVRTDRDVYAPGDTVQIIWDIEVFNRYPVQFDSHLMEQKTGRWADPRTRGATTGKIGRFELPQVRQIPADAAPGEWCYVVTATIDYNVIVRKSKTYPSPCFEVQ